MLQALGVLMVALFILIVALEPGALHAIGEWLWQLGDAALRSLPEL
jgi:hypothetical protein